VAEPLDTGGAGAPSTPAPPVGSGLARERGEEVAGEQAVAAARERNRRLRSRPPVVLMYHGFTTVRRDDDPENLFVEQGRFDAQLDWLAREGWKALTLEEYLHYRRTGLHPARRSFLLTIDDAYRSVADLAEPVLAAHRTPAVLYVPSALVGRTATWLPVPADEPLLDRDELRHLHALPHLELGLHGGDHRDMRGLSPTELDDQVQRAHDTLTDVLGSRVRSFAYPYGFHDSRARAAVARAGMQVAFSVFDDAGAYAVSRVDVNATDTLASFRVKVQVPHYRQLWRALDRAPLVRRHVRAWTTRGRSW